jgi:glycosyltransferase involved in cell wall biosynthesis
MAIKILHLMPSLNLYGGTPKKIIWQSIHSSYTHAVWNRKVYENEEVYEIGKTIFTDNGVEVIRVVQTNNIVSVLLSLVKTIKKTNPSLIQCYFDGDIILIPFIKIFFPSLPVIVAFVNPFCSDSKVKNLFVKFGLKKADHIVFNSLYTKKEKFKYFPFIKKRQNSIIYNGVEIVVNSKKTQRKDNVFNLLTIGGLLDWKNHILLINLMDRLVNGLKQKDFFLTIIGDGPLMPELKAKIKQLDLDDYVLVAGYQIDTKSYFLSSDIYLHPALNEAFGIAVIEAMTFSIPVLLSNAGAFPELIEDGKEGYLCNPKDIEEWVEYIISLKRDDTLREQLGKNAKKRVEELFSLEKFIKNYDKLYSKLIM